MDAITKLFISLPAIALVSACTSAPSSQYAGSNYAVNNNSINNIQHTNKLVANPYATQSMTPITYSCGDAGSIRVNYANSSVTRMDATLPKLKLNQAPINLYRKASDNGNYYINDINPNSTIIWQTQGNQALFGVKWADGKSYQITCNSVASGSNNAVSKGYYSPSTNEPSYYSAGLLQYTNRMTKSPYLNQTMTPISYTCGDAGHIQVNYANGSVTRLSATMPKLKLNQRHINLYREVSDKGQRYVNDLNPNSAIVWHTQGNQAIFGVQWASGQTYQVTCNLSQHAGQVADDDAYFASGLLQYTNRMTKSPYLNQSMMPTSYMCTNGGNVIVNYSNTSVTRMHATFPELQLANQRINLYRESAPSAMLYVNDLNPNSTILWQNKGNEALFGVKWASGQEYQTVCRPQ